MSDEYDGFEDMSFISFEANLPLKNILDVSLNINIMSTEEPFNGWVLGDLNICRRDLIHPLNPEETYYHYSVDEIVPEKMDHPDIVWEEWEDEDGDFSIHKDFVDIEDAVAYFEERAKKRGYINDH